MTHVFECTDKTGRRIHLSHERWRHIQEHPGMADALPYLERLLQTPDVVSQFSRDSNVRFFYAYQKEKRRFLFASVNIEGHYQS